MLTKIWLENFKGIGNRQTLDLAPVTLLFGINSAGKSTVLHALHYLRKILVDHDVNPEGTSDGGVPIDTGGFEGILHRSPGYQPDTIVLGLQRLLTEAEADNLIDFAVGRSPTTPDNEKSTRYAPQTVDIEIQIWRPVLDPERVMTYDPIVSIRALTLAIDGLPFAEFNFGCSDEGEVSVHILHSATHPIWRNRRNAAGAATETGGRRQGSDDHVVADWVKEILDAHAESSSSQPDVASDAADNKLLIVTDLFGIPRVSRISASALPPIPADWQAGPLEATGMENGYCRDDALVLFRPTDPESDGIFASSLKAIIFWKPQSSFFFPNELRRNLRNRFSEDIFAPEVVEPRREFLPEQTTDLFLLLRNRNRHHTLEDLDPGMEISAAVIDLLTTDLKAFTHLGPTRAPVPRDLNSRKAAMLTTWFNGLGAWGSLLDFNSHFVWTVNNWFGPSWLNLGYQLYRELVFEIAIEEREFEHHHCNRQQCPREDETRSCPIGDVLIDNLVGIDSDADLAKKKYVRLWLRRDMRGMSGESNSSRGGALDGPLLSPKDLGEGVTQVVPVIVTLASMWGNHANRVAAVEQPELHLHPSMAARLADVLMIAMFGTRVMQTTASASSLMYFGNLFVETHSEMLPLRILRRIRETTAGTLPPGRAPVRPADFAVYWVDQQRFQTSFQRLEISDDGQWLTRWPRGFFSEQAEELF